MFKVRTVKLVNCRTLQFEMVPIVVELTEVSLGKKTELNFTDILKIDFFKNKVQDL